jgi:hypothetical protein
MMAVLGMTVKLTVLSLMTNNTASANGIDLFQAAVSRLIYLCDSTPIVRRRARVTKLMQFECWHSESGALLSTSFKLSGGIKFRTNP